MHKLHSVVKNVGTNENVERLGRVYLPRPLVFPPHPKLPALACQKTMQRAWVQARILDKTVDMNPLSPNQCWFWVVRRAHFVLNYRLKMENALCNIVPGGRGGTNT